MDTIWQFVLSSPLECTRQQFSRAIEVWITKAHTVNRRLIGTNIVWSSMQKQSLDEDSLIDVVSRLQRGCAYKDVLQPVECGDNAKCQVLLRDLVPKQLGRFHSARELIIQDLYKNTVIFHPIQHLSEGDCVVHVDRTLGYKLEFQESNKCLCLHVTKQYEEPPCSTLGVSTQWLQDTLLPKLSQWAQITELDTQVNSLKLVPIEKYTLTYQRLKEQYGKDLVRVSSRAQRWPEKTDPHKFVYEDVGIAAYLLLVWEAERERTGRSDRQTFVDLGCGNGLLVHLLTQEGHPGVGVDIRKRKIWDIYGPDTCLKEDSITPTNLFPDTDWLIGNHSDELTPWIPVLAARSSRRCQFFVLPCCLWDFTSKFSAKSRGLSQYRAYLNYVQEIIQTCGFTPQEDMLRIPSTKRVCFIGQSRTYSLDQWPSQDKKIEDFIQNRCTTDTKATKGKLLLSENSHSSHAGDIHDSTDESLSSNREDSNSDSHPIKRQKIDKSENLECSNCALETKANILSGNILSAEGSSITVDGSNKSGLCINNSCECEANMEGTTGFKAREFKDEHKNHCIGLDQVLKEKFVRRVFKALLTSDGDKIQVPGRNMTWRKGGKAALGDLVKLFSKDDLSQLKKECGGVQTLLRNHHHVFLVRGGHVELRDWTQMTQHDQHQRSKKKTKGQLLKTDPVALRKTRLCYFHGNHPDGCPLDSEVCRFAHGAEELRTIDTIASV